MEITIKTLSTQPATIQVQAPVGAKIEIISTGKVVAQGQGPECTLEVPKCILWSDATPKLYTCRVTDGSVTAEKKFGICLYHWEGKALSVNGRPVQLRPIHFHATGSEDDLARRVLILKDSYFNAIVCSAATEELKAACDYYGIYLLTEEAAAPGDNACCVGNAPVHKLDCVAESALDPMGNPLPACAYATTRWEMELEVRFGVRPSGSSASLAESWAWPGKEGQKMDVEVYALAPSVELKLNGKSLGKKKTVDCRAVYKLPYAPGKLEASAFNGSGTRIAQGALASATGAAVLNLQPEVTAAKAGQTVFVPVTLTGENGVILSGVDQALTASVTAGTIVHATPQTIGGRGLIVLKADQTTTLTVASEDLTAETTICV